MLGTGLDLVREVFGEVTGTYAQGSNSKALTGQVRHLRTRSNQDRAAVELDAARLIFTASHFATGFSAANPVRPTIGDTYTIASEVVWQVSKVEEIGVGAGYALSVSRRVQKGAS